MHLCLTVECIASSLHFLQHCLSDFQSILSNLICPPPFLFSPPPPPPPRVSDMLCVMTFNQVWHGE